MDIFRQNEDQDKVFSYYTKQQVNIQDRWLGLTHSCVQILLLLYIVLGVIILSQGYLEFEEARGAIATHVQGDAYAASSGRPGSRYFSVEDLTYPGLENGNVFVSTRQKIYRQRRGECEDHALPCESDADCTSLAQGKCSEDGFCKEPSWCNVEEPEIYELEVGNLNIWIKSSIQFIRIAKEKIYSTENSHPFPEKGYNVFSVRDLLTMCEPVPVLYEEVSELGAAIEVQFIWNCDVTQTKCTPEVKARRVDVMFDKNNPGFFFNYPEYISEDERMLHEMQGVRIFIRSVGQGRMLSVTALVMKASTSGSLLTLAPIIADLLMLKVFSLRRKYKARKYEVSEQFSDYMARVQKREQEEALLPQSVDVDDKEWQRNEEEWHRRLHEDD